jgi:hypothetical protein
MATAMATPTPQRQRRRGTVAKQQHGHGQEANVASGTVAVDANSSGGGLAANVPTAAVELVKAVEEDKADGRSSRSGQRGSCCRSDPSANQSTQSSNINGHD